MQARGEYSRTVCSRLVQARKAEIVQLDNEVSGTPVLEGAQQDAARAQAAVRNTAAVAEGQRAQQACADGPAGGITRPHAGSAGTGRLGT